MAFSEFHPDRGCCESCYEDGEDLRPLCCCRALHDGWTTEWDGKKEVAVPPSDPNEGKDRTPEGGYI